MVFSHFCELTNYFFQMEENLGMVMVFTLVSAAIEWLGSKWEELQEAKAEAIRLKKEKDEEEERVRKINNNNSSDLIQRCTKTGETHMIEKSGFSSC